MKPSITSRQRRRLQAGIKAEIGRYQRCLELIGYVDAEVLAAGMALFATEAALAIWLSEPARLLGGKVPLKVMETGQGRRRVAIALTQIAHGVF